MTDHHELLVGLGVVSGNKRLRTIFQTFENLNIKIERLIKADQDSG